MVSLFASVTVAALLLGALVLFAWWLWFAISLSDAMWNLIRLGPPIAVFALGFLISGLVAGRRAARKNNNVDDDSR